MKGNSIHTLLSITFSLLSVIGLHSTLDAQVEVYYQNELGAEVTGLKEKVKNRESLEIYLDKVSKDFVEKGYLTFGVDSFRLEHMQAIVYLYQGPLYEFPDRRAQLILSRNLNIEMDRMEDQGYPFVKVQVNTRLDSFQLERSVSLSQGPLIRMDSVVFLDEPDLPEAVITRHLGIRKEAPYSETKIRSIDRKLKALPFLKVVRPSSVIFAEDRARVVLSVEKRNANRADGIIGFQPDAEGNSSFTGDLKLELYNALSHVDQIQLNWKRVADNTQELDLAIRYPYLFKTSVGIAASISQFRQDTTFNTVELKAGLFSALDKGGDVEFYILSRAVNNLLTSESIERQNASTIQYGLTYTYDRLDDPINPLKGTSSKLGFSYGDKTIVGQSIAQLETEKVSQWEAEGDIRQFIPIRNRSTVFLRVNAHHVDSRLLLANELDRIGGLRTLRGHDEQSIRASSFIVGTTEYRFLTGERSYFNAFLDYAYIEARTTSGELSDRPYGFGLGAAIDTKAGVLSLSYALGSRFGLPVDLNTGKVHVGYTALF